MHCHTLLHVVVHVISSILLQIFSIVVFGCLADKGYAIANGGYCLINDSVACDMGIAAGVVGMLMCLGFFAVDVLYIILKENRVSEQGLYGLCHYPYS